MYLNSESDPGKIILDVHYQRATIVKYRTDVVFGWMDLMGEFKFKIICIYKKCASVCLNFWREMIV